MSYQEEDLKINEQLDPSELTKEAKRRYRILKDPNIYKGLFFLSLPLMLNNFMRTFHDIIDMFFVGRISEYGTESVASISITFPIIFMFISLGFGLSIAGTTLISQLVGAGDRVEAKRYATNLFVIAIVTGAVLNITGYFFGPTIMTWMGAEGYTLEKSSKYLQIRSFELLPLFISYAFVAVRQADGDTLTPVIFSATTMILNIILSPIMISVFGLGVEGAAYATLIGTTVVTPFLLYQLFFSRNGLTVSLLEPFNHRISKVIIHTAIPASFGQAITAIGFAVLNSFVISFGDQTVAAFSVGNRISSVALHPVMAIGGVLAAYIGQNIGNLNPERARESFRKGLIMSLVIITVLASGLMFVREPVAGLFIPDDPETLDLAVTYLFYLLIGLPLMAVFQAYIGAYNGNGKTSFTFIVSVTRLWLLRIPMIVLFTYFTNMGSSGIWTAMLISNFVIAFIGYIFYKQLDYKPKIELDV